MDDLFPEFNKPLKIFFSLSIDGKNLSEIEEDIKNGKERLKSILDPRQNYEIKYTPLTDVVDPNDWILLKDDNHKISLQYLQRVIGVLKDCDVIFFTGDLSDSKNSRIEYRIANEYGIRMIEDY